MSELYPGAVLYDRAAIEKLPVGSIIAWGEDEDEEIAILREPLGDTWYVHNTHRYWRYESDIVDVPFRVVRLGRGKGELGSDLGEAG